MARLTRAELEARLRSLERAARRREKLLGALRARETRYRSLIEHSGDLILTCRLDGTITEVNEAATSILGHAPDQLIGRNLAAILTSASLAAVDERVRRAVAGDRLARIFEAEAVRANGTTVPLEGWARLIRDADGTPVEHHGVYRDVTERKQAEAALRASEERYRGLVDNAQDGIVTFTLAGVCTSANHAFEVMSGRPIDDLIGRHYADFTTQESLREMDERTHRALAGERLSSVFEFTSVRRDGTTYPIEARTRFIRNAEGLPVGFQGIYRDITERKRAETALRESEERYQALYREAEERNRALATALAQQTATSNILQVMSSSQTDLQPIFDAIVESGAELCHADLAGVVRVQAGQLVLAAASRGFPAAVLAQYPRPVDTSSLVGRAVVERRVVHVPDLADPSALPHLQGMQFRSQLSVPMLHGNEPVGVVTVARHEPGPFSDSEIELLKAFADQAVIAIENVRLFTELQASLRELTTALDQQTATSDILRVISQSQTDVQPVFDVIVTSAVRLFGAYAGVLTRIAGDQIELAALTSTDDAGDAAVRAIFPRPLHSEEPHSQAVRDRAPLNIADAETDPRVPKTVRASARARGYRSMVVVPLLRHDEIALLKTFADQAVIAIENVRLFTELEGRNRDLTATSEILRVISSSPTDVQPVFDTIVRSAVRLCDGLYGSAIRFDGEMMHLAAGYNYTPEVRRALEDAFPMRPDRRMMSGRAILTRTVIQVEDALEDPEYAQHVARAGGFRSMLAVPMMREGNPIGAIVVNRGHPGPFSVSQIDLLKTFADQAVIAVENARLFTELQASNRELTTALDQQTATSDILRVISQSQTDVQPVFDAIVGSAVRLVGAYTGLLTRIAGDQIELAALTSTGDAGDTALRARFPYSLHSEGPHAQAIRDRAPLNITDAHTDPRVPEAARASARVRGS